jgi:transcriptional regulator with GAF, ATPase, and Fis domain
MDQSKGKHHLRLTAIGEISNPECVVGPAERDGPRAEEPEVAFAPPPNPRHHASSSPERVKGSHEPGYSPDSAAGALDLVASLAAIGRSLREVFDPQRFLNGFSEQIQHLIPHDRIVVDYLDEDGRTFTVFAEHAPAGLAMHEAHYTTTFAPQARYVVAEWVIRAVFAGEAMLVRDFSADPRFASLNPFERRFLEAGLRSGLFVPLASGGRVIGTIAVTCLTSHAYGEAHLSVLQQVANLTGPFIENLILLERERRRRRRLEVLAGLPRVFGSSLDLQAIFDRLAEAVRPALDFEIMGAALVGPAGRHLEFLGGTHGDARFRIPARVPLEHFSFASRNNAGEVVLIRDARAELDPRHPGDRKFLEAGGGSCLLAPLWFGERVGGDLFFGKHEPNWYDRLDVEIASGIASQVALAVEHQRLAEEQRRLAVVEDRARQLKRRLTSLRDELGERYGFHQILGRSPALRAALDRAEKVAPTETTVLLTGESGTGKELVARAIHYASARAEGPFLAINCAALPETLLEDELFGHERGAFTGADRQKAGRFELAAGGSLFLDEVGELSPGVQAKLLRVLQEREFQRVGGTVTLRADVRLIAATNRDLERALGEGQFRQDLFYRLNVFTVLLPPLRERGDDVLLLAEHFARALAPKIGQDAAGLSPEARDVLRTHGWPGNIRELQNAVERALIVSDGGLLTPAQLGIIPRPSHPAAEAAPAAGSPPGNSPIIDSLSEVEKRLVRDALVRAKGNKSRAARFLGLTRFQLYTRLRRFGLNE